MNIWISSHHVQCPEIHYINVLGKIAFSRPDGVIRFATGPNPTVHNGATVSSNRCHSASTPKTVAMQTTSNKNTRSCSMFLMGKCMEIK